jgi:hypothetical protein
MRAIFLTAALLLAAPILAATSATAADDPHTLALAAGYKAAFLCSGIFNAGQTEAQVAADDLEGIYPDYQALVRTLPATVDRQAKTVSVPFDEKLPPRIAAWRPALGCAQLPIGAPASGAGKLPQLAIRPPAAKAQWPDGDEGATASAPAKLAPVLAAAFDKAAYGGATTAVLVVQDGKIVGEQYRAGYDLHTPQRTWSAAKSLTASVVGRAVQLGKVKVEAPANIPEWKTPGDPRASITLAQLMHMGSGLWTDGPGNRTDEVYLGGGAVTEWATRMPLEAATGRGTTSFPAKCGRRRATWRGWACSIRTTGCGTASGCCRPAGRSSWRRRPLLSPRRGRATGRSSGCTGPGKGCRRGPMA